MLALAEAADRDDRTLNAFANYRAAEFFMALDDPDRERAYAWFVELFDRAHPGLDRQP